MMTSKEAYYILIQAWHGNKDTYDYPSFDDINEAFDVLKQALERLEEWKQEYGNLQQDYDNKDLECIDLYQENEKLKKVIKILKDFFDFDIYAGEGKGYIDCCVENPTFDLYNDTQFKEYELLKEVMNNENHSE